MNIYNSIYGKLKISEISVVKKRFSLFNIHEKLNDFEFAPNTLLIRIIPNITTTITLRYGAKDSHQEPLIIILFAETVIQSVLVLFSL